VAVSLGVHPWRVEGVKEGWERRLREAVVREGCGIGEIGLDARMGDGLDAVRRRVFRVQLEMSYELGVPASLHCRGAWGEMLDVLLQGPRHPAGLLIHAYSGPAGVLGALAEKNVSVSFGGSSARLGNKRAVAAMRAAVEGFYLLETDAPDLPPELPEGVAGHLRGADGKLLSEPCYLPLVVRRVGEVRGVSPETVAEKTTAAWKRLFGVL
jgi:TatD DNase family protein